MSFRQAKALKKKELWGRALAMAGGATIKDDPKLLKKTLKRQEQKKTRSEKQWAERLKTVEENLATRQERRAENIRARAERKNSKSGGKKVRSLCGLLGLQSGATPRVFFCTEEAAAWLRGVDRQEEKMKWPPDNSYTRSCIRATE